MQIERDALPIERQTLRRLSWQLMPYLMLCYFVSYIDRINVGFAALQMRGDVGLSPAHYGLGASLFLLTYCVFAVPSSLGLKRFGPRRWIAFLMIVWGCISVAMVTISGPKSFYLFRLLLGAAEAGFLPSVIFYLACWFPRRYRAGIASLFLVAIPASSFIGSPLSASLLTLDGWHGLGGWQWLFILEGIPAVLLGLGCLIRLPDTTAEARWLSTEQRRWLDTTLARESDQGETARSASIWQTLTDSRVIRLCLVYAGVMSVGVCLSLWQPQIIQGFGLSDFETGVLSAIPFGIATLAMVLWGRDSDRRAERTWHVALPLALSGIALALALATSSLLAMMISLSAALVGTYGAKGPFWAMVTQRLPPALSATGIAIVSSAGSLAAAISTYALGVIEHATGSYTLAMLPMVVLASLGTLALLYGHTASAAHDEALAFGSESR